MGYLPAVPVHRRAVQPGLLLRHLPGRGPVLRHQQLLVRGLLVVGVPDRPVDIAAEVRAMAGLRRRGRQRGSRQRGHVRDPDRRAVELHPPADPAPAEHRQRDRDRRRRLRGRHRIQRQLPGHQQPVRLGRSLRLRHHERAAFRLLGPGRLGAVPDLGQLVPGRLRHRGHRPVGEHAGAGLELLELLDRPPGQRHRAGRLQRVVPAVAELPDGVPHPDHHRHRERRPWAPSSPCRSPAP